MLAAITNWGFWLVLGAAFLCFILFVTLAVFEYREEKRRQGDSS